MSNKSVYIFIRYNIKIEQTFQYTGLFIPLKMNIFN